MAVPVEKKRLRNLLAPPIEMNGDDKGEYVYLRDVWDDVLAVCAVGSSSDGCEEREKGEEGRRSHGRASSGRRRTRDGLVRGEGGRPFYKNKITREEFCLRL